MDKLFSLFAQHGLLALFFGVLVEQLGAPIPAMPFLLLAGVASASNGVFAVKALVVATVASMSADLLWFYAGRRLGRRVLALLCRISISPDSCVRQNELSFARRGVATLVIAKFIPGLSTLASPMAGAIGMGLNTFAVYNLAGTLLWAGSGIVVGLIFHDQVGYVLDYLHALGTAAVVVVVALLGLYVAWRAWRRWRMKQSVSTLPRVQPRQLADWMARGDELVIVDVRTAVPQPSILERIPGAQHIELSRIESLSPEQWSSHARIVTYCACPNDASALKAAYLLTRKGLAVSVLQGGVEGWAEAGYPLESGSP